MIKKHVKTLVDITLTGVAMNQVGTHFTGGMRGIGSATQVVLGAGTLKRAAKRYKLK